MKQVIRKSTVLIGAMILTGCAGLKDVDHKWCPPEQQGTVENISLKADALFKFDKSSAQDMLPKGVAELNELAAKLGDAYIKVDQITSVGHTDRLGSDSSNQALSERRVQTVADYLQQRGVQAPFLVRGMGETQPVVECSQELKGQALKDCLQPNRRVELEIQGVKKQ